MLKLNKNVLKTVLVKKGKNEARETTKSEVDEEMPMLVINKPEKAEKKTIERQLTEEQRLYFDLFLNRDMYPGIHKFSKIKDALTFVLESGVPLPIFSYDLGFNGLKADQPKKIKLREGAKGFLVTGYDSFWRLYSTLELKERYHYEIVTPIPCKMHIDAEYSKITNPDADSDRIDKEFKAILKRVIVEWKLTEKAEDIDILTLESSNAKKVSLHYIVEIKGKLFRNNFHCGAFIRKLRNYLVENYGPKETNMFFFWGTKETTFIFDPINQNRQCYMDMAIYTLNRNFRLFASSKRTTANDFRILYKQGDNPKLVEDLYDGKHFEGMEFNKSIFMRSLILRYSYDDVVEIIDMKEKDGSEPQSTSHKLIGELNTLVNVKAKEKNAKPVRRSDFAKSSPIPDYTRKLEAMIEEFIVSEFGPNAESDGVEVKGMLEEEGYVLVITRCSHCMLKRKATPSDFIHGTLEKQLSKIFFVVNLRKKVFYQKCCSENASCSGKRTPDRKIPDEYLDVCSKYESGQSGKFGMKNILKELVKITDSFDYGNKKWEL